MKLRATIRRSLSPFALILGVMGLAGCSDGGGHGVSGQTRAVVAGNNAFALDLYERLKGTDGNLFLSPYSISESLAVAYAGARNNTSRQIAQVMRLGTNAVDTAFAGLRSQLGRSQKQTGIELSVANGLWVGTGHPLLPGFCDVARQNYEADVKQVDFRTSAGPAVGELNSWVAAKTKGRIKDIIPAGLLDSNSRLVLVNAIYFKGTWKSKFNPKFTRDSDFHLDPDHVVRCPMMACSGKFRYCHDHTSSVPIEVIELPYVGGDFSLIAILSTEWEGLADVESKLTLENLDTWLSLLRETDVQVVFPKFSMQIELRLEKTLAAMGMSDAFTRRADFSGIDGTDMSYISSIAHRACFEVNEEGTTATAATATHSRTKSMPPSFRADHPFLFLIRHNRSGSILFLGRVVNPTR